MLNLLADQLIKRAKRTPYAHLPGYMERWWLVPYRAVVTKTRVSQSGELVETADGTGPARGFRPIAWLLQRFDIAARVHHILRSDDGRDPHDHPWSFVSIVLRGRYVETQYDERGEMRCRVVRKAGSIAFRPAGSWHRIDLLEGETAWTLFITGRYQHGWGFNVGGVKVPYREYLEAKREGANR